MGISVSAVAVKLMRFWFTAIFCMDTSMLAGLALALAVQYMSPNYFKVPYRTPLERGLLAIAFMLLLMQACSALLWDMWHDNSHAFAQFPLGWRFTLTFPAVVLANVSLIRRALRIERRRPLLPPPVYEE